jgi:hypothetical protein
MYYHPMMLDTLRHDRTLNIFRALNDVWFESIQRQREVQANAVATVYNAHVDHARALTELTGTAELAVHFLARATSAQLKLLAVSAQLSEIAADTQRQAVALLQSQPPPAPIPALAGTDQKERRTGSTELTNRKAQMMA